MPYLSTYADVFWEGCDHTNDEDFIESVVFHICAHVVRSRDIVVKHNSRLKRKLSEKRQSNAAASILDSENNGNSKANKKKNKIKGSDFKDEIEISAAYHDQGFTRPKVLILTPFRGSALKIVKAIKNCLGKTSTISQWEKFEEEFEGYDEDANEDADGAKSKPDDWNYIFKDQNVDDDFKFGLQINPGQGKGKGSDKGSYVRLYSDFFLSDVIIASPLGLRLVAENKMKYDYLSSLEMILVHQADVLYMQNWEHVCFMLSKCNRLPEHDSGTDFSRIRPYFLEENSKFHRQLIVMSAFNDPKIQSFVREFGHSHAGNVRLKRNWKNGIIANVSAKIRQTFCVIPTITSFADDEDMRFEFFRDKMLNHLLKIEQKHTLIVTPSYLSFVRLRNELIKREADAVFISEYSRDSEISRGRSRFFQGHKSILLYSGRSHFFRRYMIRGALHVMFYSLPEYPQFYSEIVNLIGSGVSEELKHISGTSCTVLMSKCKLHRYLLICVLYVHLFICSFTTFMIFNYSHASSRKYGSGANCWN